MQGWGWLNRGGASQYCCTKDCESHRIALPCSLEGNSIHLWFKHRIMGANHLQDSVLQGRCSTGANRAGDLWQVPFLLSLICTMERRTGENGQTQSSCTCRSCLHNGPSWWSHACMPTPPKLPQMHLPADIDSMHCGTVWRPACRQRLGGVGGWPWPGSHLPAVCCCHTSKATQRQRSRMGAAVLRSFQGQPFPKGMNILVFHLHQQVRQQRLLRLQHDRQGWWGLWAACPALMKPGKRLEAGHEWQGGPVYGPTPRNRGPRHLAVARDLAQAACPMLTVWLHQEGAGSKRKLLEWGSTCARTPSLCTAHTGGHTSTWERYTLLPSPPPPPPPCPHIHPLATQQAAKKVHAHTRSFKRGRAG